jgi:hypothetical protein
VLVSLVWFATWNGEMTDVEIETIVNSRLHGVSVRAIAKQLKCSVEEVNATLDALSEEISVQFKIRAIAIEARRLDELTSTFYAKAVAGCTSSAELVLKIAARRAEMFGLNCPTRVDVVSLRAVAQPAQSGTDKILAVLEQFKSNGSGENTPPP